MDETLIDRLPHGILDVHGGEILTMNYALRSWLGARYEKLDDLVARYPKLSFLLKEAGTLRSRSLIDLDGTLYYVLPRASDDGLLISFIRASEISDATSDPATLQQSYEDLIEIFQNCFDGIYVADGDGKTLWMNAGFERCYGLSARNFVGRNASELEREGHIDPLITWKVITTKKRQTALQRTTSGRHIIATGIPLFDTFGRVRKVIINSRDTTELVELQSRLSVAKREIKRYESEVAELRSAVRPGAGLMWASAKMQEVIDLASRVAMVDSSVLIAGESGVGKEVIAKLLHSGSRRASKRIVQINCGAIPRELLESELFGHEEGAFTGSRRRGKRGLLELAHEGTLFLDEIGEMPLALQVKLLRVLEDGSFTRVGGTQEVNSDFRLITATNRDLGQMIREGAFREDLYYRINVIPIVVPPLRERPEDIMGLAQRFLIEFRERYDLDRTLSEDAMERLIAFSWPGNVRQLRNLIERAVVTSRVRIIDAKGLPLEPGLQLSLADVIKRSQPDESLTDNIRDAVTDFERTLIMCAVKRHGTIRAAAEATGLSESTIKRKLVSH
jgi:PAS domain S-box-containing protein